MRTQEEDVKIFTGTEIDPADEGERIAARLLGYQSRGVLEQTRQLGAFLAGEVAGSFGEVEFGKDASENSEMLRQRRMLLTFAVLYGSEIYFADTILAQSMLGSFYDALSTNTPELYRQINESGAFSFYYLAVRRNATPEQEIGRAFAMLCGEDDNTLLCEMGRALYIHFMDKMYETIQNLGIE